MKINFAYHEDLPTSYTPGSVYFVKWRRYLHFHKNFIKKIFANQKLNIIFEHFF